MKYSITAPSVSLGFSCVFALFLASAAASACATVPSGGDGGDGDGDGDPDGAVGGGVATGGMGSGGGTGSGGGSSSGGGAVGTGGGAVGTGGGDNTGSGGAPVVDDLSACDAPGLTWKTARKTNYESYPDPGSAECEEFNGCTWAGWFYGCTDQQTEQWVAANNIAAVFPGFDSLAHHRICLRSGNTRMIVNVIDTCADSDCEGCCTDNLANNDALVDLEKSTNERWGLEDGIIEWADIGLNPNPICD